MGDIVRGNQTQKQVAEVSPEYAFQSSGNVGVVETEVAIGANTNAIAIKNTHATQTLAAKFKSSTTAWNTNTWTIAAGKTLSLDLRTTAIKLTGSGAATTYEILATKE